MKIFKTSLKIWALGPSMLSLPSLPSWAPPSGIQWAHLTDCSLALYRSFLGTVRGTVFAPPGGFYKNRILTKIGFKPILNP